MEINSPVELAPAKIYGNDRQNPFVPPPRRRPVSPPKHSARPLLPIDLKSIAVRYCDEILDAATVAKVEAAIALVAEQKKIVELHCVPISVAKADTARKAYAANPTPANLKTLREATSLDWHGHAQTQHFAQHKMAEIIHDEIAPLLPPILTKAAALLAGDAAAIAAINHDHFASFGMSAPVHPLSQSLAANSEAFLKMAEYAGQSPEMPQFLEYLVAAFKDTSRQKPDLRITKMFMLPAPVEDVPVVEENALGTLAAETA
jgi:hypothetical protein